jgi:hypothetical protein
LHGDNVILVSGVDEAAGARVTGTLRIADMTFSRRASESPRLGGVLHRSPEILAFAGCTAQLAGPKPARAADQWCEQLRIE